MLLFKPMEKKLRYPRWLLRLFVTSVFSWLAAFIGIMIKLAIAIVIWQLPIITDWIGLWFALSNLAIAFCIWKASKYPDGR